MAVTGITRILLALAPLMLLPASGRSAENGPSSVSEHCPALAATPRPVYWVCAIGHRRIMLESGDLSARVSLADLPAHPGLIGVGPLEGLKGEITIDQGTVYISTMRDGEQVVSERMDGGAIFLAFGAADSWQAVEVPEALEGGEAIEAFIKAAAQQHGLHPAQPFPFRITGAAEDLDYHVMFMASDGPHGGHGMHHGPSHGHHAHKQAKIPFKVSRARVTIVGIWADEASGDQYTHHGQRTHMHVLVDDPQGAGHVDKLALAPGATLFLPRVTSD